VPKNSDIFTRPISGCPIAILICYYISAIIVVILFILFNKGDNKMISYEPLFEYLKKNNIKQAQLIRADVCTHGTISHMKHNKPISVAVLDKILNFLDCSIDNVIQYTHEDHIPRPLL
jgi:DNA-binding Xre family transcriptional regulator